MELSPKLMRFRSLDEHRLEALHAPEVEERQPPSRQEEGLMRRRCTGFCAGVFPAIDLGAGAAS